MAVRVLSRRVATVPNVLAAVARDNTGPYGDGFGARPDGLSLDVLVDHPHGIDLGPGVAYRKKMNWNDPLLPFRIRQEAYNPRDLVICFGPNSQVREKRPPKDKD